MRSKLFLIVVIVLFSMSKPVPAQKYFDFGLFGGTSYYMGEINHAQQFYYPSISFGALARYNLNKRYAFRLNGYYGSLKASDSDFTTQLPTRRPMEVNTKILEYTAQFEINFLPYLTGTSKNNLTTYIAFGIGYAFPIGGNYYEPKSHLSIPVGAGIKFNVTDKVGMGAEWSFRKTFTDSLDGIESPLGKRLLHNNDWYSFAGIFITYKFFNFAVDCPTY